MLVFLLKAHIFQITDVHSTVAIAMWEVSCMLINVTSEAIVTTMHGLITCTWFNFPAYARCARKWQLHLVINFTPIKSCNKVPHYISTQILLIEMSTINKPSNHINNGFMLIEVLSSVSPLILTIVYGWIHLIKYHFQLCNFNFVSLLSLFPPLFFLFLSLFLPLSLVRLCFLLNNNNLSLHSITNHCCTSESASCWHYFELYYNETLNIFLDTSN